MEAERDLLLKRAGGDTTRAWKIYERMLSAAATRGEPVDPRTADAMRRALLGTGEQADMFGEAAPEKERRTFTKPAERPVQQSLEGLDEGTLFSTAQTGTPEFKRWFGDWEAAGKLNALKNMPPVQVDTHILGDTSDIGGLRKAATNYYKENLQNRKEPVVNQHDKRKIKFTNIGIKETRKHSADVRVLKIVPNLVEILTTGMPLGSVVNMPKTPRDNTRAWHYYAAPVVLDGVKEYARLVVREDVNGNIYYDNDITSTEMFADKMQRGRAERATRLPKPRPDQRDLIHSIPELLNFVNPSS